MYLYLQKRIQKEIKHIHKAATESLGNLFHNTVVLSLSVINMGKVEGIAQPKIKNVRKYQYQRQREEEWAWKEK